MPVSLYVRNLSLFTCLLFSPRAGVFDHQILFVSTEGGEDRGRLLRSSGNRTLPSYNQPQSPVEMKGDLHQAGIS